MRNPSSLSYKFCITAGAIVTWFAVIMQLYLNIQNMILPLPQTIIKFFSFFTILTNIIVAIYFTGVVILPDGKWRQFLLKPQTSSAINLYIFVVGLVYNTVLRWQWSPQGWQLIVDNLLHVITPLWFLVYWWAFVPKNTLQYKQVWAWLIYPVIYCIYILIRGAFTNMYPYFFVDAVQLGYTQVAFNIIILVGVFLALALLEVVIARKMSGLI